MSGKQEREKRRQERMAAETKVDSTDKRKKLLQVGAGAAFLAVVVVVALIVIASSGSDGGDASNITHVSEVNQELGGLEQEQLVVGDPNAPVEVVEFGDLQCPVCKSASENVLPPIFEGPVAQGQAKISFRNFTVLGPESETAAAAAVAAANQGRGWNFVELFYRNQGREHSEYITDDFLTAVAEGAGVADIDKWNKDRESAAATNQVEEDGEEALRLGFEGTPSFAVKGPNTNGYELLGTLSSAAELESAINAAS